MKSMCERTGVTLLALGHFNKRSDVGALHKVGGAVALTGVPRAVWLFMKDPRGEKGDMLMLLGKGNLSRRRTGMRYVFAERGVKCDDGGIGNVPVIEWKGEETDDADTLTEISRNSEEKASQRAERFLRDYLADDEKPSEEVLRAAEAAGIKRRTLFEVKKNLGIRARKHDGVWWWQPLEASGGAEGDDPYGESEAK
jgi:hypothetical protein